MFQAQIDVSTFGVTVSAVAFAWHRTGREEPTRLSDVVLLNTIKTLHKSLDADPQEGDVFTQKALATSHHPPGGVVGLSLSMGLMLRHSEIVALEREHVHIHEEYLDFTPHAMIPVELIPDKSFIYRRQSASYFLSESSGIYDPKYLCEEIGPCHNRGSKSS